jgi:hypothetical protein
LVRYLAILTHARQFLHGRSESLLLFSRVPVSRILLVLLLTIERAYHTQQLCILRLQMTDVVKRHQMGRYHFGGLKLNIDVHVMGHISVVRGTGVDTVHSPGGQFAPGSALHAGLKEVLQL